MVEVDLPVSGVTVHVRLLGVPELIDKGVLTSDDARLYLKANSRRSAPLTNDEYRALADLLYKVTYAGLAGPDDLAAFERMRATDTLVPRDLAYVANVVMFAQPSTTET